MSVDADLLERARRLVNGSVPSKNQLRKTLKVGHPKINELHRLLMAEREEEVAAAAEAAALEEAVNGSPAVQEGVTSPPLVPPARRANAWPYLICAGAFVAIWSGWVELGRLTGFGVVHPFPGVPRFEDFRLNTAITLPVSLEAYAAYALRVATRRDTPSPVSRWARRSALISLFAGVGAQAVLHLMIQAGWTAAPWPVTVAVSAVPVAVVAMFTTLWHKVNAREEQQ